MTSGPDGRFDRRSIGPDGAENRAFAGERLGEGDVLLAAHG